MPEPTNGGKTYEFTLRKNLEYSDGTPVKASDFENTMKRLLKLGSVWSSFYSGIVGVPEFQEKGDFEADIKGIETDDASGKITINLTEPDTKILFALAEPYTAPTPAAKSPGKSLKQPPPGVGPYTLDIVDFSRKYVLTKNPKFDLPGIPKGKFDNDHGQRQRQRHEDDAGRDQRRRRLHDRGSDGRPASRGPDEVQGPLQSRLRTRRTSYYFFLNHKMPPFDKKEAREAVNYALDSRALVRIFGGRLTPGCTFLPPDLVGYENFDCKYGDPNGEPDIEKAKQLVKDSGYEGEKVTVWTNNKDPRPAIADYYRDVLNEIGFDADIKTLDQQVYFEQVGLERTKAQTGFTDWYQDYPHPGDFIDVAAEHGLAADRGDQQPGLRERSGARQEARRAAPEDARGGRRRVGRARRVRGQRPGPCGPVRL